MESIAIYGNTHTGLSRKANQDACVIRLLWSEDKALAVVIDGVGGYAGGERAAAIARECIDQYMQLPSGDMLTMLREAVIFANNRIAEERKKDQRFSEMCCVLTALVADTPAKCIYYVHVGDTRLYRYRRGQLQKLTRDHSFVGIREDAGEIAEEEAMAHPHRNQILREVGSALHRLDDEDFMDYGCDGFEPGDLMLLCSDGLTDMVTSQQITGVLSVKRSLNIQTDRLIELANAAGGKDNITVALLQYPVTTSTSGNNNNNGAVAVSKEAATFKKVPDKKKKKQWGKTTLVSALLLLIMVAGAGWYFITPKNISLPVTGPFVIAQPANSIQKDSSYLKPGGRTSHVAVQGPLGIEKSDTLRISATQNFADLKRYTDSTGNTVVLVPEKYSGKHFAAIAITGRSVRAGDTLLVRNLKLAGFENGIDIHLPILLKAENLVFENTTTPFRYLFKPGEKQASILFINNVKQ